MNYTGWICPLTLKNHVVCALGNDVMLPTGANISSINGQQLHWVNKIKYFGVHIVRAKSFKCDMRDAKRFLYNS